jgi:hypothetical protein
MSPGKAVEDDTATPSQKRAQHPQGRPSFSTSFVTRVILGFSTILTMPVHR